MSDLDNALDGANVAPEATEKTDENQENKQVTTTAEDAEKAKHESGVQKRINELTYEKHQEKREKLQIAARLAEVEAQLEAQRHASDAIEMPTLESSGYDERVYAERLARFTKQQALEAIWELSETQNQNARQNQEADQLDRVFQNHDKQVAEFVKTAPDYHQSIERLASVVQFTPDLALVVGSSDKSPDILYYLANNLDEADQLMRMPPALAAAQIVRIEAKLSAPAKRTTSNAPDPVPSLSSGNTTLTKDDARKSDDEWYAENQRKPRKG